MILKIISDYPKEDKRERNVKGDRSIFIPRNYGGKFSSVEFQRGIWNAIKMEELKISRGPSEETDQPDRCRQEFAGNRQLHEDAKIEGGMARFEPIPLRISLVFRMTQYAITAVNISSITRHSSSTTLTLLSSNGRE